VAEEEKNEITRFEDLLQEGYSKEEAEKYAGSSKDANELPGPAGSEKAATFEVLNPHTDGETNTAEPTVEEQNAHNDPQAEAPAEVKAAQKESEAKASPSGSASAKAKAEK
jgi:hypothetical protein